MGLKPTIAASVLAYYKQNRFEIIPKDESKVDERDGGSDTNREAVDNVKACFYESVFHSSTDSHTVFGKVKPYTLKRHKRWTISQTGIVLTGTHSGTSNRSLLFMNDTPHAARDPYG